MTEEFDEDVVFQNSPLFQYLQDLGHTDFEACAPVSQDEDDRAEAEGACLRDTPPPPKESWVRKLMGAVRRLSLVFSTNAAEQHERQLDAEFRRYALRCVLSQDVLLQEDIELIELLDPSILSLGSATSACPSVDTAFPRPQLLAKPTVWDISILVCLAAVLAAACVCDDFGLPAWACVLCLSVCVVLRCSALRRRARQQKCVWEQCVCVERLVTEARTLTSVCRKSLRLVQETEVIYRGFTLLLDRVSGACPFNRAGPARQAQQLIGLRKAAYQSLRSAFRGSRLATCIMLKTFPLSSEMDNVVNYVSSVPIKELGLGLGPEHLTDDQVQELTDDYSLPALKMLFQLWVGQSSEFFRRLALLLSPGRQEDSSLIMHGSITTVTRPLQHTLSGCLGDLQRSYDFHRYFEMQLQSQNERSHSHTRQRCHELNTLHSSVRSLQLHLKTLLNEVIILEDELEKLMVAKETVAMTVAGYQELQERLTLLQPHMQASSGIWDDTLAQVDKMLRRATNCTGSSGSPDSSEDSSPPVPEPIIRSVSQIADKDPVPEEQELEAYVSDSDSEPDCGLSLLSPWERERMRREGEESRRVLLELKSVLGFRASETERHKRQVLLFNEQAAVKPVAGETSEPNNQTEPSEPDVSTGNHVAIQQEEEGEREAKEERKEGEEGGGGVEEKEERHLEEVKEESTEFSCGVSTTVADADAEQQNGEAQLFQFDGTMEEEEGSGDGPHALVPRIPALTVMDRLTEMHGAETLSFSSAIAAQVAARSHTFTNMQEHTFGDSEEDEDEEEEEEEEREGRMTERQDENE
ncbi:vezatin isoform X1 [Alosa sapidissima]|uniref:vezatin isoform X1 n=2 Tax=Alosa sapidissima TaxID=34773 RepID=UPI001C0A45B8|nr:vezatin isoform X1 [Alosa sapidissima]